MEIRDKKVVKTYDVRFDHVELKLLRRIVSGHIYSDDYKIKDGGEYDILIRFINFVDEVTK